MRALFREANVHTFPDLQQQAFPPIIGVDQLSILLDKSPASIFADCRNAPEKLPPSYRAPGAKSPRWITDEVIQWLMSKKEDLTVKPATAEVDTKQPRYKLPDEGYVRLPQVLAAIPVSRSTWWSGIKSGRFPKPIKLGPRTTAWRVSDIRALIEA